VSEVIQNRQWILLRRPANALAVHDLVLRQGALPELLGPRQILFKTLYLHLAPTIRNWMNPRRDNDENRLYPDMPLGSPVKGPAISQVIRSTHPDYPVGSCWFNIMGWQEYAVLSPDEPGHPLGRIADAADLAQSLSVLGPNGLAAYFGMTKIARIQPGETVVVSGAAGSTGSVAAQIAKIIGCRVIGIAGGASKCAWLKDTLGLDAAIDYKSQSIEGRLAEIAPDGVNAFFDNVGADTLSAVIENMAVRGRIALCGQIATYNDGGRTSAPLNVMRLVYWRVRIEGFIMSDWWDEIDGARAQLAQWVAQGKIRHREDIREGFETIPAVFNELFSGTNQGTLLVKLADRQVIANQN
jgi:NADPH-dependent curcumin reductase CurA